MSSNMLLAFFSLCPEQIRPWEWQTADIREYCWGYVMRQDRAMPCKHRWEYVNILHMHVHVCVIMRISVGLSRGASLLPFQTWLEAQNLHVLHPMPHKSLRVYYVNGSLSCTINVRNIHLLWPGLDLWSLLPLSSFRTRGPFVLAPW